MNISFYIAARYLVSKKSRNAINIISIISILGVAVGTAALIICLSVFNGFEGLLNKLNNSFDPDIKITPVYGKAFLPDKKITDCLSQADFIESYSFSLEENALLQYNQKQIIATIKGVDEKYFSVTGIDTMIVRGRVAGKESGVTEAIVGAGLSYSLGLSCDFVEPLQINIPSRTKEIHGNFNDAANDILNTATAYASGVFAIQQEYDTKYVILPLNVVQRLLEYDTEIGAIEIKLKPKTKPETACEELSAKLGEDFSVLDRKMQHAYNYKIMQSEKWAVFMILVFILLIASFNIIASITMLIIDKKNDISIIRSMGGNNAMIRKIFFIEGIGISIVGAVIGLIIGGVICWLQMEYGFVKLGGGEGAFIINAYPVEIRWLDIAGSFAAVMLIGLFAALLPVRYVTNKLKNDA
ncbi:MAG: ABC transporter permease [Bacteroidales bacterium]|nr:ABC transporter permease [Bacteroidales bacterium]